MVSMNLPAAKDVAALTGRGRLSAAAELRGNDELTVLALGDLLLERRPCERECRGERVLRFGDRLLREDRRSDLGAGLLFSDRLLLGEVERPLVRESVGEIFGDVLRRCGWIPCREPNR